MTDQELPDVATVNVTVYDDPATRGLYSHGYVAILGGPPGKMSEGDIAIYNGKSTCLRFCVDGSVYVNATLVDTDMAVYQGIRELLGLGPKEPTP